MANLRRRTGVAGLATALVAALSLIGPALAAPPEPDNDKKRKKHEVTVQLLSFNDFHGHLEAADGQTLDEESDPRLREVGGAEYLATTLERLRRGHRRSLTVAAGDLIGGSTFLSGLFHDEPTVQAMEALGLDLTSVGNHEFDEGTTELLRMQHGGCHPEDGCYFPRRPYDGAEFPWLAANVEFKGSDQTLLPAYKIKRMRGVKVGFIGMTTETTPALVSPSGVDEVNFLDEVRTANRYARILQRRGVKAIVLLLHEGGYQTGRYNRCEGISGPVVRITRRLHHQIDAVITGHTHEPYLCSFRGPRRGLPRMVTSAASFGSVVTELDLVVNKKTGQVKRRKVEARNHLVTRDVRRDARQTRILERWQRIAAPIAGEVVGTVEEDITGDADGDRSIETPMADLIADSILWGTSGANGGAQISFMNVGGVRASLLVDDITNNEDPGEITYAEAYEVMPFGNLLVSMDLTGAQIEEVLEQQYQPIPDRGSRPMLALGVSEGFTYSWNANRPQGRRVVPGSMMLNGQPVRSNETYRVSTLNFLADGGDSFTAFTQGTNVVGGPEDLANLVAYLEAHPGLTAPEDRVEGL